MTKQEYIEVTKTIYTRDGKCAKCGYHTPIRNGEALFSLMNLYKYEGELYDRVCLWKMVENE